MSSWCRVPLLRPRARALCPNPAARSGSRNRSGRTITDSGRRWPTVVGRKSGEMIGSTLSDGSCLRSDCHVAGRSEAIAEISINQTGPAARLARQHDQAKARREIAYYKVGRKADSERQGRTRETQYICLRTEETLKDPALRAHVPR